MAIIIRIDVDRPYGRQPLLRHILSRFASDFYLPVLERFGYLKELRIILELLNEHKVKAYVFFRRCTLPSKKIFDLLTFGKHVLGLHLEDSRSYESFSREKSILESHIGYKVYAFSKHGSGGTKYGFHHYAPYEPDKYIEWAKKDGMTLFLGNLENPEFIPSVIENGLSFFPSAFWLEPAWRDVTKYTLDWLIQEAKLSDIVLLIHPENVLADPALMQDFKFLLRSTKTKILE